MFWTCDICKAVSSISRKGKSEICILVPNAWCTEFVHMNAEDELHWIVTHIEKNFQIKKPSKP